MDCRNSQESTLKEIFITQIENKIISWEFEIGQKLPPERELACQMGVSRAVVNAGIVEMSRKGFLEIRPRVGTFVSDFRRNGTIETLVSIMKYHGGTMRPAEIKSLLEFRSVVDSMVIRLIGSNLSDEDAETLDSLVESIGSAQTPAAAAAHNFRFHHELALISGNTIVPLIYSSFRFSAIYLWERFARKYGISCLYSNSRILLDYIKSGQTDEAVLWKQRYTDKALSGEQQIYED